MSTKWNANKSLLLSRAFVITAMICCVTAAFFIPTITGWYVTITENTQIRIPLTVCCYLGLAIALLCILVLFQMLNRISRQQIFVTENVTSLRIISWCCFGIGLIFLVPVYWEWGSMLITFIASFFGLIMRVLKNVFQLAVELREENDYTI